MTKNQRIKLYIIISILLFFIVYLLEQTLTLKQKNLEGITLRDMNKVVKTNVIIAKQTIIKDNSFLTLKNNQTTIQAVFFKLNQTLEKNREYEIIGKITPYQNKPQINIIEIY
jgi:hypothetical protein